MFKRIAAGALAGWTGILGMGWWLANERIGLCDGNRYNCAAETTGTRDLILIGGLLVPFIAAVVVLLARANVVARGGGRQVLIVSAPKRANSGPVSRFMRLTGSPARVSFDWRPTRRDVRVVLAMVISMLVGVALVWWSAAAQPVPETLDGDIQRKLEDAAEALDAEAAPAQEWEEAPIVEE
jgi:hypothetical protein